MILKQMTLLSMCMISLGLQGATLKRGGDEGERKRGSQSSLCSTKLPDWEDCQRESKHFGHIRQLASVGVALVAQTEKGPEVAVSVGVHSRRYECGIGSPFRARVLALPPSRKAGLLPKICTLLHDCADTFSSACEFT